MQTTQLQTTVSLPALMDQTTVAEYLGKSVAWCERSRWDGSGPRFVKIGKAVKYRAADLMAWIEENARTSSSQR
jgi:predicted DNA-binding transcriptional regulator AlpA